MSSSQWPMVAVFADLLPSCIHYRIRFHNCYFPLTFAAFAILWLPPFTDRSQDHHCPRVYPQKYDNLPLFIRLLVSFISKVRQQAILRKNLKMNFRSMRIRLLIDVLIDTLASERCLWTLLGLNKNSLLCWICWSIVFATPMTVEPATFLSLEPAQSSHYLRSSHLSTRMS